MIAIIDYNAGNLKSVQNACAHLGAAAEITADKKVIRDAQRIIFPGVGRAAPAMRAFRERGFEDVLKESIAQGKPVLAICVGAQLILDYSEEDETRGLGLIRGQARRFCAAPGLKVPHMGWNEIQPTRAHPLLDHLQAEDECYFAHAYYPAPAEDKYCYAMSDHGQSFCSAFGKDNLFATQFHPEKSGAVGLALLNAFVHWDGKV